MSNSALEEAQMHSSGLVLQARKSVDLSVVFRLLKRVQLMISFRTAVHNYEAML